MKPLTKKREAPPPPYSANEPLAPLLSPTRQLQARWEGSTMLYYDPQTERWIKS